MIDQTFAEPELFIALVAPAGTRRRALITALTESLDNVGYAVQIVRFSEILKRPSFGKERPYQNECERIRDLQKLGNEFRAKFSDGAAIARAALRAIRATRAKVSGDADTLNGRTAYILDQLKHPAEIDFLRDVYGSSLIVVGAHAPREFREAELSETIAKSAGQPGDALRYRSEASILIDNDDKQDGDFSQNTRDAYPKADFFVNIGIQGGEKSVERLIELLFGNPFPTPTPDEYAMYHASAASLRSSDVSRQVGAAVAATTRLSADGRSWLPGADVVAVGANEVPFREGGLYWPGQSPDTRDQALGQDRGAELRAGVLVELLERLPPEWFSAEMKTKSMHARAEEILPSLKGTKFLNIGEFGRTVHAEMAALMDAARRGVSVNGQTIYVTTFPCHNCAKHIIAAGIRKVVYLEPYPKSRAGFLHGEEMILDPVDENYDKRKVAFTPFSGVAPRQYQQLFSMALRGGPKASQNEWNSKRKTLVPRYVPRNTALAYLAAERTEVATLSG